MSVEAIIMRPAGGGGSVQRGLAAGRVSLCWKFAAAMERSGDASAFGWWQRAYNKLSALKQSGRFVSPQDEQVLQQLRRKLNL